MFLIARSLIPSLRRAALPLAAMLVAALGHASPISVQIDNQTTPTRCAEEDNVSIVLRSDAVRRFSVEALQPDYLPSIVKDIRVPDFSNCNFDGGDHPTDPQHRFQPRTEVLHDGPQWRIVGMTLPVFWRPHQVPIKVNKREDRGFHLVQIFKKVGGQVIEAIVFYPADGYWRLKPLPAAARFGDGVYGSSFVMGPIEQAGRPVATITSIDIRTWPLEIRLRFADDSSAIARVREVSKLRTALDVQLLPAPGAPAAGKPGTQAGAAATPFAVLRSMYVAPDNADMSEVRWQSMPWASQQTRPLPAVNSLSASSVRFGRSLPSLHNTSAPDIRFTQFAK